MFGKRDENFEITTTSGIEEATVEVRVVETVTTEMPRKDPVNENEKEAALENTEKPQIDSRLITKYAGMIAGVVLSIQSIGYNDAKNNEINSIQSELIESQQGQIVNDILINDKPLEEIQAMSNYAEFLTYADAIGINDSNGLRKGVIKLTLDNAEEKLQRRSVARMNAKNSLEMKKIADQKIKTLEKKKFFSKLTAIGGIALLSGFGLWNPGQGNQQRQGNQFMKSFARRKDSMLKVLKTKRSQVIPKPVPPAPITTITPQRVEKVAKPIANPASPLTPVETAPPPMPTQQQTGEEIIEIPIHVSWESEASKEKLIQKHGDRLKLIMEKILSGREYEKEAKIYIDKMIVKFKENIGESIEKLDIEEDELTIFKKYLIFGLSIDEHEIDKHPLVKSLQEVPIKDLAA